MPDDFLGKFSNMPKSEAYDDLKAIRISKVRDDFLVKGPDGEPIFLLQDVSPIKYIIGRKLRYIAADFQVTCNVKIDNDYVSGQFAMISCNAESPELHDIFLRCVAAAVGGLPAVTGTVELEKIVHELLETFRSLSQPALKEISGLWAELWTILQSNNISRAVEIWHSDIYEKFDFSAHNLCIEVKSTTKNFRIHDFSLEQLNKPNGGKGFVISVMLQAISGGSGILDLAETIEGSLKKFPDLRIKLWDGITKSLGKDFSIQIDKRFDTNYAEKNFVVYNMTDIPTVGEISDARISNVKFSVDLSDVSSSLMGNKKSNLDNCFSL